ncbi:hypothetical protein GW17_00023716 [Ensete ventricosum]|nr:hypothetical protein GW17_00023716 [Ensete ventricosum]
MVDIAAVHLGREAIQWYDWYKNTYRVPTWRQFKSWLLLRFRPTEYENTNNQLVGFAKPQPCRNIEPGLSEESTMLRLRRLPFMWVGLFAKSNICCFIPWYNTMIRGHVCGLDPLVALSIFRLMLCIGIVLDYHTYPSCLRLAPCPLSRVFKYGMRFLGETVKARLDIDIYVLNV